MLQVDHIIFVPSYLALTRRASELISNPSFEHRPELEVSAREIQDSSKSIFDPDVVRLGGEWGFGRWYRTSARVSAK
jgi:hypothetical protein